MAKPYFAVACGNRIRISERTNNRQAAVHHCFGPVSEATTTKIEGAAWRYRSHHEQTSILVELARRHKLETGNTVEGYEKETTDILGNIKT